MQKAIALKLAVETVVRARKANANVTAIWNKLDRVASYLNQQLSQELTDW